MTDISGQQYTPFPKLLTRFVDPATGQLEFPWHRFLIALWRKTGGSNVPETGTVVLSQDTAGDILAYAEGGGLIGTVQLENQPGGPVQVVAALGSPRVYAANASGALVTSSGKFEISRDSGGNYYSQGLTGGSFPLKRGDQARITWLGATAPTLVFFPDSLP